MNETRDLLVFEHIPKTAGSTMHAVLWRLYGRKHVFMATIRGRHHEHIDRLCQRLHDRKPSLNAIVSHIGFGFHERLSADYQYRHYTFLRDPVERVLSHYHLQIQRQRDPIEVMLHF